jgi:hypothetical protein
VNCQGFRRNKKASLSFAFLGEMFSVHYFNEDIVGWIQDLFVQWRARKLILVCPHCKRTPSRLTFEHARFMVGEHVLTCEQCGKSSYVTLWRFEGASYHGTSS